MPSSPWDPFRDMSMLQERMNRLFEESLARSRTAEDDFPMGAWMPAKKDRNRFSKIKGNGSKMRADFPTPTVLMTIQIAIRIMNVMIKVY